MRSSCMSRITVSHTDLYRVINHIDDAYRKVIKIKHYYFLTNRAVSLRCLHSVDLFLVSSLKGEVMYRLYPVLFALLVGHPEALAQFFGPDIQRSPLGDTPYLALSSQFSRAASRFRDRTLLERVRTKSRYVTSSPHQGALGGVWLILCSAENKRVAPCALIFDMKSGARYGV